MKTTFNIIKTAFLIKKNEVKNHTCSCMVFSSKKKAIECFQYLKETIKIENELFDPNNSNDNLVDESEYYSKQIVSDDKDELYYVELKLIETKMDQFNSKNNPDRTSEKVIEYFKLYGPNWFENVIQ